MASKWKNVHKFNMVWWQDDSAWFQHVLDKMLDELLQHNKKQVQGNICKGGFQLNYVQKCKLLKSEIWLSSYGMDNPT